VWPRLNLGAAVRGVTFWFLIYSALATIAGFLIARPRPHLWFLAVVELDAFYGKCSPMLLAKG